MQFLKVAAVDDAGIIDVMVILAQVCAHVLYNHDVTDSGIVKGMLRDGGFICFHDSVWLFCSIQLDDVDSIIMFLT